MKNLILKFGVLALCAAIMASCVACGENTSNEQMQNRFLELSKVFEVNPKVWTKI